MQATRRTPQSPSNALPAGVAAHRQTPSCFIGIDVAKDELVIAKRDGAHAEHGACTITNQPQAITRWLQTLPAGSAIAMESTGRYHQSAAHLARVAGFAVYVLNAKDVHYYARALGSRGKTDRLDAQVIARYIAEHHSELHTWSEPSGAQQTISELLSRRALLANTRHRA